MLHAQHRRHDRLRLRTRYYGNVLAHVPSCFEGEVGIGPGHPRQRESPGLTLQTERALVRKLLPPNQRRSDEFNRNCTGKNPNIRISSVETQKGVRAVQRCSIGTRAALSPETLYSHNSDIALLVFNGTSLISSSSALLALN